MKVSRSTCEVVKLICWNVVRHVLDLMKNIQSSLRGKKTKLEARKKSLEIEFFFKIRVHFLLAGKYEIIMYLH